MDIILYQFFDMYAHQFENVFSYLNKETWRK